MSTHHNHSHGSTLLNHNRSDLIKASSYVTITAACLVIIAKIIGWFMSDSLSILASTLDSFLDIISSIINFLALRYALQPPDNEHRFGHDKAEDLAIFMQSIFFGFSGLFLVYQGVKRLVIPQMVQNETIGIYIMTFSIIVTTILVCFQRYVLYKTKSRIVEADNFHYFIDLLTNVATIGAIYIGIAYNSPYPDPIFALIVASVVLKGSWQLLDRSFKNLMDHELENDKKEKIIEIIKNHPEISGFHDLKTRYAGNKPFVQFHVEIDSNFTLMKVHLIVDALEHKIREYLPQAEIIIHQDPYGVAEEVQYKD